MSYKGSEGERMSCAQVFFASCTAAREDEVATWTDSVETSIEEGH